MLEYRKDTVKEYITVDRNNAYQSLERVVLSRTKGRRRKSVYEKSRD